MLITISTFPQSCWPIYVIYLHKFESTSIYLLLLIGAHLTQNVCRKFLNNMLNNIVCMVYIYTTVTPHWLPGRGEWRGSLNTSIQHINSIPLLQIQIEGSRGRGFGVFEAYLGVKSTKKSNMWVVYYSWGFIFEEREVCLFTITSSPSEGSQVVRTNKSDHFLQNFHVKRNSGCAIPNTLAYHVLSRSCYCHQVPKHKQVLCLQMLPPSSPMSQSMPSIALRVFPRGWQEFVQTSFSCQFSPSPFYLTSALSSN